MQGLYSVWHKISHLGVEKSFNYALQQRITLANQIGIVFGLGIIFLLLNDLRQKPFGEIQLFGLVTILAFGGVLWLNTIGRQNWARWGICIFLPIIGIMCIATIARRELKIFADFTATPVAMLILLVLPFLILEIKLKWDFIGVLLLNLILPVGYGWLVFALGGKLSPNNLDLANYFTFQLVMVVVALIIIISLLLLQINNWQYAQYNLNLLKELQQANHKIRVRKDKLENLHEQLLNAMDAIELSNRRLERHREKLLDANETIRAQNDQLTLFNQTLEHQVDVRTQQLRESQDLFATVFNQATDAIFLIDCDTGCITDCNQRALELFEAEQKSQLLGKSHAELETPHKKGFKNRHSRALSEDELHPLRETRYLTLKGNDFWGSLATRDFVYGNKPLRMARITDINELKKSQNRQKELYREVLKNNEQLRLFAFMTSHDLRRPVANILGLVYLLEDGNLPPELAQLLKHIQTSTRNLDDIVHKMNDILKNNIDF
ncbi:MAG: PAS domain S-box protein [Microscillaceae bacterium]|jgi:PAS domain S-box-containing protein|nr:PAS domain S-box protein [Microscillaceae bacterium]